MQLTQGIKLTFRELPQASKLRWCSNFPEMKVRSIGGGFVLIMSVVLAAHCLWAEDGVEGALSRANLASSLNLSHPFGGTLAVADFDNDHKLDGAILLDSGRLNGQNTFRIDLSLSSGDNSELIFESDEIALAVAALDVNEDGATDLVVEQTLTHQRLYVWLNDGHGDFHSGRIEDFQHRIDARGDQFDTPSSLQDCAPGCLGPQRGTETARLTARSLSSLPPLAGELKILSTSSSPKSRLFSADSSRAPPLSL